MIQIEPMPVKVGYWHYENLHNEKGNFIRRKKELRFDNPELCYEGTLLGFGQDGDSDSLIVVGLIHKNDGRFDTADISIIQTLSEQ